MIGLNININVPTSSTVPPTVLPESSADDSKKGQIDFKPSLTLWRKQKNLRMRIVRDKELRALFKAQKKEIRLALKRLAPYLCSACRKSTKPKQGRKPQPGCPKSVKQFKCKKFIWDEKMYLQQASNFQRMVLCLIPKLERTKQKTQEEKSKMQKEKEKLTQRQKPCTCKSQKHKKCGPRERKGDAQKPAKHPSVKTNDQETVLCGKRQREAHSQLNLARVVPANTVPKQVGKDECDTEKQETSSGRRRIKHKPKPQPMRSKHRRDSSSRNAASTQVTIDRNEFVTPIRRGGEVRKGYYGSSGDGIESSIDRDRDPRNLGKEPTVGLNDHGLEVPNRAASQSHLEDGSCFSDLDALDSCCEEHPDEHDKRRKAESDAPPGSLQAILNSLLFSFTGSD